MLIIQNSKVFYKNEIYISTSLYVINIYIKERTKKETIHINSKYLLSFFTIIR